MPVLVWRGPVQLTAKIVDSVHGVRLRFYGVAFKTWSFGLLVKVRARAHELTKARGTEVQGVRRRYARSLSNPWHILERRASNPSCFSATGARIPARGLKDICQG